MPMVVSEKITKIARLSDSPSKTVIFKSGDEFIIVGIIALMICDYIIAGYLPNDLIPSPHS